MSRWFPPYRRFLPSFALVIAISGVAYAQTPPDAGSVLRQIEQQRQAPLPPRTAPLFAPPPPLQALGRDTVTVASFRFVGNTLLTTEQLRPTVAGFLGRPLTFAQLQDAAVAVAAAYRQAGWIVRVYLPQQDLTDGTVTIQVVEAVFGAVRIEGTTPRVSDDRLKSIVQTAQASGRPLNAAALDRAILLVDDLPGVSATGRLSEGRNQAETDLVLSVTDGPLLSGIVTADNAGARATGSGRVIGQASLGSPLRLGDRLDAVLLYSDGSDYVRGAWSVPLGSGGWRVGVNATYLAYRVVSPEFSRLHAHGTSTVAGLEANYPLLRSRLKNVYVALSFDDKRFDNRSAGSTVTNYKVRIASAGLYGNAFDSLGGGGSSNGSIALDAGRVNLGGSANEAADAATTRTAGDFRKLRFSASRQQSVSDSVSLYGGVSGQLADRNLDSSERFYLGGSTGVRAYPANEGSGSEGLLANLEVRGRLPANLDAVAFFDWGAVRANHDDDFVGAARPNRYNLKGVGASLGWVASFGISVKGVVARRIGHNPNPTADGKDQDGSLRKYRFWLQASAPF